MNKKSPLQDKVILVVDDEPDVLDAVADELDMCRVIKETTYDGALKHLQTKKMDMVILDIMGVNGFELLKRAVQEELPAVMLTAHALSVESLKKSIDLGARAYIPKEKIPELVPILEDVLTLENKETWQRSIERLGEFFNATFGLDWKNQIIETGPFVVPRK
jgi:DNA-binding response OmpR family regulator